MAGERLLNLGSGDHPVAGWVNVDVCAGLRPDVLASALDLPFPDEHFDRVYLGHVLEHVDLEEVPRALCEVRRVLRHGASCAVVGPDYDRVKDGQDAALIDGVLCGGRRWPGDEHRWVSTAQRTFYLCVSVFEHVEEVAIEELSACWPVVSRASWQFALVLR